MVAYASRGLSPSERHYPAHKLEFLALRWAIVDKFHDYLYGQKFTVFTDNNPLTYVLTSAKLDATGHRWIAQLSCYDFDIKYKVGSANKDADALSRLPSITLDVVKAVCDYVSVDLELAHCHSMKVDVVDDALLDFSSMPHIDVKALQQNDPCIYRIIDLMLHNNTLDKMNESREVVKLWSQRDKLILLDEILFRQITYGEKKITQLVVPSELRSRVMKGIHEDMGHPGRDKSLELARNRFYWPGMATDIERMVISCRRCICRKGITHKAPLHPIITSRPLELLCVDYLLVEPSSGYEHLLVITDHFTKFARVVPTKNESSKTTARVLFEFMNLYGYPEKLHSDQGKTFEANIIKELCKLCGVIKTRTTPYHPQGNGACERMNQTLLKMLGTMSADKKSRWKDYLGSMGGCRGGGVLDHESRGKKIHFHSFTIKIKAFHVSRRKTHANSTIKCIKC